IKAGITGGIGSGKSMVCRIFSTLGVSIYNADDQAKILMNTDPELISGLTAKFGNSIYNHGILDKKKLAEIIFNDPEMLLYVNKLVHPVVSKDSAIWFQHHLNEPYALKEAAIFFESGTDSEVDVMITVIAPIEVRIRRIMDRDGLSGDQVKSRMENQLPDEMKILKSDY